MAGGHVQRQACCAPGPQDHRLLQQQQDAAGRGAAAAAAAGQAAAGQASEIKRPVQAAPGCGGQHSCITRCRRATSAGCSGTGRRRRHSSRGTNSSMHSSCSRCSTSAEQGRLVCLQQPGQAPGPGHPVPGLLSPQLPSVAHTAWHKVCTGPTPVAQTHCSHQWSHCCSRAAGPCT